jgi:uncharacterized membrane protein YGL010W
MLKNTKLSDVIAQYGVSHQNPTNQKIHKLCVPLILWSLLGLLSQLPGPLNWAYVLIAFALIYYAKFKSARVYLIILLQVVPMMFVIHYLQNLDFKFWVSVFALAWIGQFIGHKIEGKKPSFFEDIFFLLIGPIWILKGLL